MIAAGTLEALARVSAARWERYAAKLRAADEPLTFAEIEPLRTRIPDEQNGARVIERLRTHLDGIRNEQVDESVLVFGFHYPDFLHGVPRSAIGASRRFLADHQELLHDLSAFERLTTGRFNVPEVGDPFKTLGPYLSPLRIAVRLEHLNTAIMLIDGDMEEAGAAARLQFHISAALDEHPSLVAYLVQMSCDSLARKSLEGILCVGELEDPALIQLARTIDTRLSATTMKWALLGYRAYFQQCCDQVASGELSIAMLKASKEAGSRVARGDWVSPQDFSRASRRGFDWIPDVLINDSKILGVALLTELVCTGDDGPTLLATAKRIDDEVARLPRSQGAVKLLMMNWKRTAQQHLRSLGGLKAARLAVAAEQFRLKAGRLPESLDELVPQYLDAVPTDPFDGQPMRFAVTEKGIVIYSVGANLADDGGIVAWQKTKPHHPDVGFRLFQPQHRGLLLTDEAPPEED